MDSVVISKWKWQQGPSPFQFLSCRTRGSRTYATIKNAQGCVLAVDVGTGGTKAALISRSGGVMSTAFAPHEPPSPSPMGWQASAEQDQESWWLAAKIAIKDCLLNNSSTNSDKLPPDAIAITGQMQDVILLPKGRTSPQRKAILYSDARASVEAAEIAELAGGSSSLASATGQPQGGTSSILAKLRWLDKNDIAAAAQCKSLLLGGHDYVVWKLCGVLVTDATTASTTGLTDRSFQYAESLIKRVNLGHWLEMLPYIAPVDIPCAGEVSEAAAAELGFPFLKAVPVLHCCGDAGACSLGAGAGSPGSIYGYLGTSGWVAGSFRRPKERSQRSIPGVFTLAHPNSALVFQTGSIMTAGGNLAWAASNLINTSKRETLPMSTIDELAKVCQVGCGGLLYLPFLSGERCPFEDPTARAAFIGISNNTSMGEMFRSIMEGVSFAMLSAQCAMLEEPLADSRPLRLVGGGASSPIWPQIIASVFGQTVEVLEEAQDVGVKGAALLAGKWLGWHDTLSPDGDWLKIRQTYYPCEKASLVYNDLFATYNEAYHNLRPIFQKLSPYWK
ncbi:uncharacterized protein LOC131038497 isoform X3 [Cryptomeria japonica]|uniref:uncharacterized protein LOC131038497 isoform X3 n=1 Tax=Cryptomeria japonica TaxID=3369 RepID=UPI0027DA2D86|nr:uncharacterized protein LOC131038497 isoform X3 [Cryptomeria japonica]